MKKNWTQLLVAVAAMLMAAVTAPVFGQENLLVNPGFEPPYDVVAGVVPGQIAQGWSPWSVTVDGSLQPEYYPATDVLSGMGEPRIVSGADAQQYFTFFSSHVGGVYQRVAGITPGAELEFAVNAYLWASSGNDPDVSDPTAAMTVEVGIDPFGGEDGASPAIVWSAPVSPFDAYALVSVSARAEADAVTVFVRSTVNTILMNNVVYLDDAALMMAGGVAIVEATESLVEVTPDATLEVTVEVTAEPTVEPTVEVTAEPTVEPTVEVTAEPTVEPTVEVTVEPTVAAPTNTDVPTVAVPTNTDVPTVAAPTNTDVPTVVVPTNTDVPTVVVPTALPTQDVALQATATTEIVIIEATATLVEPAPIATLVQPTPIVIEVTAPPEATIAIVEPTSTPVVVEAPALGPTSTPATTRYVVQYGDSLSSIAWRFRVSTRELARLNRIVNPNLVFAGSVLLIPSAGPTPTPVPTIVVPTAAPTATPTVTMPAPTRSYRVLPGDNLYGISIRYGVRISDIIRLNRIVDANRIYVGQLLQIP